MSRARKTSRRSLNDTRDRELHHDARPADLRATIKPLLPSATMAMSCRYAAQSCARQLRSSRAARAPAQTLRVAAVTRRHSSTEAEAPANPKISGIVDQISQLTLLETADLVSSLKVGCP